MADSKLTITDLVAQVRQQMGLDWSPDGPLPEGQERPIRGADGEPVAYLVGMPRYTKDPLTGEVYLNQRLLLLGTCETISIECELIRKGTADVEATDNLKD